MRVFWLFSKHLGSTVTVVGSSSQDAASLFVGASSDCADVMMLNYHRQQPQMWCWHRLRESMAPGSIDTPGECAINLLIMRQSSVRVPVSLDCKFEQITWPDRDEWSFDGMLLVGFLGVCQWVPYGCFLSDFVYICLSFCETCLFCISLMSSFSGSQPSRRFWPFLN